MEELIERFEAGQITKEEWNHQLHLKIALWYIYNFKDFWLAFSRFKLSNIARLRRVNSIDEAIMKYHETVTIFWLKEINDFYWQNKNLSFNSLFDLLLTTKKFFDKEYIYKFYYLDTIRSNKSRVIYVQPDILPDL